MTHSITIGALTLQLPCEAQQLTTDCPCVHVQLPTGTPHTVPGHLQFPGLPVPPGASADMDRETLSNFVVDLCTSEVPCIPLCLQDKLVLAVNACAVCQVMTVPDSTTTAQMLAMWQDMTAMDDLEQAVVAIQDETVAQTFQCLGVKKSFVQHLRKALPAQKIYVTASTTVSTPSLTRGLPPKPTEALLVVSHTVGHDTLEQSGSGIVQVTLAHLPPMQVTMPQHQPQLHGLRGQASPLVPALGHQRNLAVLTPHDVPCLVLTRDEAPPFQLNIPAGPLHLEQLADAVLQGTGCDVTFAVVGASPGLAMTAAADGLTVQLPGQAALALTAQTPVQLPLTRVGLALRGPLFLGSPDHAPALEAAGFTVARADSTQIAAVHVPSMHAMLGPLYSTRGLTWDLPLQVAIVSIHAPDRPAQLHLTGSSTDTTVLQIPPPETVRPAGTVKVHLKPPSQHHAQLLQKLLPTDTDGKVACSVHELKKLAQDLFALPVQLVQQALAQGVAESLTE